MMSRAFGLSSICYSVTGDMMCSSLTTARRAYSFIAEHPDVIVLDLRMPELDGITVLKEIRRVDRKQPVIILTGDTSPETEREVRALGVSEFIVKGSSLKLLEDTLTSLLEPSPLAMGGPAVK